MVETTEEVARARQNILVDYVKEGKFSRQAFQVFKRNSGADVDVYLPKVGLTLGQYFVYDTLSKAKTN